MSESIMTFDEFVDAVKNNIRDYLPENMLDAGIRTDTVQKLNESYLSLQIRQEGQGIVPNINLDKHYDHYLESGASMRSLDAAFRNIAQQAQSRPALDTEWLRDYESVKDHLFIRVSNAQDNSEILKNTPHREVDGLAVTYHIAIGDVDGQEGSVRITDNMLKMYGVDEAQLHADALTSAQEILPVKYMRMSEMMAGMMGMDPADMAPPPGTPELMVLTNEMAFGGAASLFYPGKMDEIASQLGSDFFVIPSSIHEILIIPDDGSVDSYALESIIQDVNATTVSPEEQLANYPYHYDAKDHILEKAETFNIRMEEKELQAQQQAEMDAAGPESLAESPGEKPHDVSVSLTDPAKSAEKEQDSKDLISFPEKENARGEDRSGKQRDNRKESHHEERHEGREHGVKGKKKSILGRLNEKKEQLIAQPRKDTPHRAKTAEIG